LLRRERAAGGDSASARVRRREGHYAAPLITW
jgi:hypothetical protein